MKNKIIALNSESKTVLRNVSYLIESLSLLIVAFYNYTNAYHAHLSKFELTVRVAASVVIGLRGGYEFLRYLRNKEVR